MNNNQNNQNNNQNRNSNQNQNPPAAVCFAGGPFSFPPPGGGKMS